MKKLSLKPKKTASKVVTALILAGITVLFFVSLPTLSAIMLGTIPGFGRAGSVLEVPAWILVTVILCLFLLFLSKQKVIRGVRK